MPKRIEIHGTGDDVMVFRLGRMQGLHPPLSLQRLTQDRQLKGLRVPLPRLGRLASSLACFGAIALLAAIQPPSSVAAADLEMVDGFGNITGVIDISRRGLTVFENSGARFFYQREPRYDLPGGRYLGFYNPELNRVVRFPRSGHGPIERADLDAPIPRFIPGLVSVRPIGSGPGFGPYLSGWLGQPAGNPMLGGYVVPGYPAPGFPGLGIPGPGSFGPGYLGPGYAGPGYIGPGYGAPGLGSISLNVGIPGRFSGYQPRSVLLESSVLEKPALAPVEIEFVNSHHETLIVTLTDTQNPGKTPQYQLAPGQHQRVKLPRDAGHTRVEVYQTTDVAGLPIEQEVRVNVPPEIRYEVVVHRMRIQSIAIDRTGKSPNPIEDVNMQGVGVGRFPLPPGDQLNSGTIDVFQAATGAANPGVVAPLIPSPR
ncbi:hypothetical protein [Neorhodopirellula lusitana]|nr:hypothetical protein [Neorhodopirellula lusitana]